MSRLCACGCGRSLEGKRRNSRYASSACRTRDWKDRRGIVGVRYVKASQNGKSKPSGCQVSYKKAETFVRISLSGASPELAAHVLRALRMALPERQLARLQAREEKAA